MSDHTCRVGDGGEPVRRRGLPDGDPAVRDWTETYVPPTRITLGSAARRPVRPSVVGSAADPAATGATGPSPAAASASMRRPRKTSIVTLLGGAPSQRAAVLMDQAGARPRQKRLPRPGRRDRPVARALSEASPLTPGPSIRRHRRMRPGRRAARGAPAGRPPRGAGPGAAPPRLAGRAAPGLPADRAASAGGPRRPGWRAAPPRLAGRAAPAGGPRRPGWRAAPPRPADRAARARGHPPRVAGAGWRPEPLIASLRVSGCRRPWWPAPSRLAVRGTKLKSSFSFLPRTAILGQPGLRGAAVSVTDGGAARWAGPDAS